MSTTEIPGKWDHEADVIIAGGGTAGLPAGITIAEAGLHATILESSPACGGSFHMVAGDVAIAGSDEQQAAGINDSPEIFYRDLMDLCGADPEIARVYVDNQLDSYNLLKSQGIQWPNVNTLPGHSRPRGLKSSGFGSQMVKALEDRAHSAGVEILTRHRATRLITHPSTGRIIGLKVSVKDETRNFKAKKAVVLASGGFGRNREMLAEYAPEMVDCIPKMPTAHLGDGLRMGLAVGAATKDLGSAVAPSWPVCIETHSNALRALFWGGILVNVHGKRFHDESCSEGFYGPMAKAGMKQPGGFYWVVYDQRALEEMKRHSTEVEFADIERCKKHEATTIEALANSAGIDARGLTETIDKYNRDIDSAGYDTVFGRKFQLGKERPLVRIDRPPFYAIKCVTSITSLKGGLKINGRAQVVNQYGEIIPGLYAAGEVTGGLHTRTYLLGVMSSAAMTFGIIAGRNAVKEPAWQ